MSTYRVIWEIDVQARGRRDAAEEARRIQRDTDGLASFFKVSGPNQPHIMSKFVEIDLSVKPYRRTIRRKR
jgi:hypothetical protein